jgi:DNA-binding transcriptional LysR family regulator
MRYDCRTRMIDLNDIQIFVAAVEKKTLTEAASDLGVPPSTVSRALTRLEKRVGVMLVQRNTRGMVVTDAGKDYLVNCERALDALREADGSLDRHRTTPHGRLRLGVPGTFARDALAPILKRFVKLYPDLRLQIELHDCERPELPSGSALDMFLQVGKPQDSSWRIRAFPSIRQCLLASPSYIAKYGMPSDVEGLRTHLAIGYATNGHTARWNMRLGRKMISVELALLVSVGDPGGQRQLVMDGLGIGQLPLWAAQTEVDAGHLVPLLPEWDQEPLVFYALFRHRSSVTPKVKVFLDFIQTFIATQYDPRLKGKKNQDSFETMSGALAASLDRMPKGALLQKRGSGQRDPCR